MANRSRPSNDRPAIALHHRDDATCPDGPKMMMGEAHRVGCAQGPRCRSARPSRGGAVRAVYYARVDQQQGVRAMYLCASCAAAFAEVTGLSFTPVSRGTR